MFRFAIWGIIGSGILWFILSMFGWSILLYLIAVSVIGEIYKFVTEE